MEGLGQDAHQGADHAHGGVVVGEPDGDISDGQQKAGREPGGGDRFSRRRIAGQGQQQRQEQSQSGKKVAEDMELVDVGIQAQDPPYVSGVVQHPHQVQPGGDGQARGEPVE